MFSFLSGYTATICGHRTKRKGRVSAFGQTIITEMPRNDRGSVDYCLDCIGKMAIRCAWCGQPIFIGDPITLFTPTRKGVKLPDYAVTYNTKPLQLVGCLRENCCDTIADRAGFWLPDRNGKGYVERVPTAYEAILHAAVPSKVVISDVRDIAEAKNPKVIPLDREGT